MSFIGSMFSGSGGAGFNAQDQSSVQNANAQAGLAQNALNVTQGSERGLADQYGQIAQNGSSQVNNALCQGNQMAASTISIAKVLNPALAARMGAQQGAQATQQGAALQNQIQQNAMGQQASIYGNLGSQSLGALGNYTNLQGGALNSQTEIAKGNQQAQSGLIGGIMNGAGSAAAGMAQGGMVPQHFDVGGPVGPADGGASSNPGVSAGPQSMLGKYFKGLGSQSSPQGGQPQGAFSGIGGQNNPIQSGATSGFSGIAQGLANLFGPGPQSEPATASASSGQDMIDAGNQVLPEGAPTPAMSSGQDMINSGNSVLAAPAMSKGGKVPVVLSPGEKVVPKEKASEVAKGKAPVDKLPTVPGKASVKGNSLKNDTVPADLSAGDIVIPRSELQGKDPHKQAAKFVAAVLARQGMKKAAK